MTGKLDLYVPIDSEHKGELTIGGNARIDGHFIGTLHCEGTLSVGHKGYIEGTVECLNAEISGSFSGCLHVHERCILFKKAQFSGAIDTKLQTPRPTPRA